MSNHPATKKPPLQGLRADLPTLPNTSLERGEVYQCTDEDTFFYLKVVANVQSWVPIGAGGIGQSEMLQFPIALVTADSTHQIPANAVVLYASVEIDTPYTGGTSIEVGNSAALDLLLATADIDPTTSFVYDEIEPIAWGGTARTVRVTIAGGPVAGAGLVTVLYAVPRA